MSKVKKDWRGNSTTAFTQLGASNHSELERPDNDYYATDPKCGYDLIAILPTLGITLKDIWEPACGEGHLAKVFDEVGKLGKASDLIDRGYGEVQDFLESKTKWTGDIVTNPPYSLAEEFLLRAMDSLQEGNHYCSFLKLTWLEGKKRKEIFKKYPPKYVLVYSERQLCARNGEFDKNSAKAIAYCWYVWQKGFIGDTKIKWV